ncbi:hypothetical protein RNZ50_18475 [Paracoccaceae bacterium Fryx2]|nr:hypothetical protein [Paracoccaceae bacterium Fryx2]
MTPETRDAQRRAVADEFLQWITLARRIIADHFPAERSEPHNQMVVDTARSLMLAQRLGQTESTLEGLRVALVQTKEN